MTENRIGVKYAIFVSESVDERITEAIVKAPALRRLFDDGETFDAILEQIICAGLAVYESTMVRSDDNGNSTG